MIFINFSIYKSPWNRLIFILRDNPTKSMAFSFLKFTFLHFDDFVQMIIVIRIEPEIFAVYAFWFVDFVSDNSADTVYQIFHVFKIIGVKFFVTTIFVFNIFRYKFWCFCHFFHQRQMRLWNIRLRIQPYILENSHIFIFRHFNVEKFEILILFWSWLYIRHQL